MKATIGVCLALLLAGSAAAMAQSTTPAEPSTNAAPPAEQSTNPAPAASQAQPDQPAKPKKAKTARKSSAKKNTDATASTDTGEPTPKKTAARKNSDKPVRSGARIYKENGKTCSGEDQYKVCW